MLILSPGVGRPYGGLERFAEDLHDILGTDSEVLLFGPGDIDRACDTILTIRRGRGGSLRYARRARRLVRDQDPTVVYAVTWKAAIPWLLAGRRRPPLVLFALGSEMLAGARFLAAVRRKLVRGATAVVAISAGTAASVRPLRPDVTVVNPWLSARRLAEASRHRARPMAGVDRPLRVLSVGRLVPRKGHHILLDAVEDVRAGGEEIELTIVGDGPERAAIADRLDPQDRLRSGLTDEELVDEYARADAFALMSQDSSSEVEGFGIVLLEAAAHGLPLVVSGTGGMRDAFADNALVAADAPAAADALRRLATDAALRRRLAAASTALAEASGPERARHELHGIQARALAGLR